MSIAEVDAQIRALNEEKKHLLSNFDAVARDFNSQGFITFADVSAYCRTTYGKKCNKTLVLVTKNCGDRRLEISCEDALCQFLIRCHKHRKGPFFLHHATLEHGGRDAAGGQTMCNSVYVANAKDEPSTYSGADRFCEQHW